MSAHDEQQAKITTWRRKETVEAFQFTDDLALLGFEHRDALPWGLAVCGQWHPMNRTVTSAYVYVRGEYPSDGHNAKIGDWVVRVLGRLAVVSDKDFRARYEPSAALRASPETGWQPIETAPKQGWVACGYWYDKGCWAWGRGCYHFDEHHPEGYFIMEGGGKPTHWMLLPAPPEVPHA